ncbi:MAG TPA: helix-turn-helix domain-containing protein [Candidatus Angelobacter sp.]|nr:helix-turn-helix domain-containing protein [Candidatus Angelobacter sp.]
MPRSPSDPDLKAEFATRIREKLNELSAAAVAAALGVKRQMVYKYKDGRNAPSMDVIRRAMEAWPEFTVNYRGKVLRLQDFERRPVLTARQAIQYELWDVIKKLNSQSVEIEILDKEPSSSSVQLGIRIYFRRR